MNKLKKKKRKKLQPFDLKKINTQSIDRLILVAIAIGSVIGLLLVKMLYLTVIKDQNWQRKLKHSGNLK